MSANGQLTAAELGAIEDGRELPREAANAWNAARTRQSWPVDPEIRVAGAYRSLALQQAMYANPSAYGATVVATPGNSVHGQAPGCIDIWNWAAFGDIEPVTNGRSRTLNALLAPYGWVPDSRYPKEPWHYVYVSGSFAGGDVSPIGDDMPTIQEIHDDIVGILRSAEFSKSAYARSLLDSLVETDNAGGVGKVYQAIRDTRQISRSTQIAVEALSAAVAAGSGLDPDQLTTIIDQAVEAAVTEHMPSADDIAAALAEVVPDADPAAIAAAVAPLLTVTVKE